MTSRLTGPSRKLTLLHSFTFKNGGAPVLPALTGAELGTGPATLWTSTYGDAANQNLQIASGIFVPNRLRQQSIDNVTLAVHVINLDGTNAMTNPPRWRVFGRLQGGTQWFQTAAQSIVGSTPITGGSAAGTIAGKWNAVLIGEIASVLYPEMYIQWDSLGTFVGASDRYQFNIYVQE